MPSIEKVVIVGSGWVGRQVAARLMQAGLEVWLSDRDESACRLALDWIERVAKEERPGPRSSVRHGRIHIAPTTKQLTTDRAVVSRIQPDLVIESVPEQLSLKKRVLKQLALAFEPPTIIASNTSYFVPSLLAPYIAHPKRYAHVHFHVPVLNDSVVDIVGCPDTDSAVIQQLKLLTEQLGLYPLMLRREHPGYVFNWMLQALLKSALELAALDVVDIEDIDKSWRDVTGMRLGPFGIMDQIGLDVIEQVLANARWAELPGVESQALLDILHEKTRQGKFGTKSLEGFYKYDQDAELH